MESAIHIGNKIDRATAEHLKEVIEVIFRAGGENKMDQETIRRALSLVGNFVAQPENVTLENVHIEGDEIINTDDY